ncbi:MAG: hypothetical protein ABJN22_12255 [Litorimonas sp.]
MGIQNILIRDESMGGKTLHEFSLSFPKAEVTVSDIIRERVRYEVEAYNRKAQDKFFGLVRPSDAEESLNGYKLRKPRRIDADKQIKIALKAFSTNGFIMLIDNQQAESLDQKIELKPDMNISFLKLTPLVGG